MKKYFYLIITAVLFVTGLLVLRPKTTPPVISSNPSPTAEPVDLQNPKTYKNTAFNYQFKCPGLSQHAVELSSGDGTVKPFYQETCHQGANQVRFYVHTIPFYDTYSRDPSITLSNYQEGTLNNFKTISFTDDLNTSHYEIFLTPSRIISLSGYGPDYFNFIRNSLEIIALATPTPQLVPDVGLMNTADWSELKCQNLSFKIPKDHDFICNSDGDQGFNVVITTKSSSVPSATIVIRNYNGGSRRQYWIDQNKLTPTDLKSIVFQESKFGQNSGLEIFSDKNNWQDSSSSPILITSGRQIIMISGGRSYDLPTNSIIRSQFTDTLASTVKIVDN